MRAVVADGQTHVALLRGVNVGGHNKVPMKDLAAIFAGAGCTDVHTYIQSGNVVFRATPAVARRVGAFVSQALSEQLGIAAPVVTRTAPELRAVVRENPFLRDGADAAKLHVAFLAERPAPSRVAALDPARSPPDAFTVRGREVYLHLPGGVARTRLTNQWFDSALGTTSTIRNWRTVVQLAEMVVLQSRV